MNISYRNARRGARFGRYGERYAARFFYPVGKFIRGGDQIRLIFAEYGIFGNIPSGDLDTLYPIPLVIRCIRDPLARFDTLRVSSRGAVKSVGRAGEQRDFRADRANDISVVLKRR